MNSITLLRKDKELLASAIAEKKRRETRARHSRRGGLIEFIRYFWDVLEPQTDFVDGWPLEAICQHLEAITFGELNPPRLLENVPPGFMKPVHVDEPVYTDRGFKRLGDIQVGDRVLTHKGRFRLVTAVHDQGEIPIVELLTHGGRYRTNYLQTAMAA